jgi:mono/diheme cytochrome c family protein
MLRYFFAAFILATVLVVSIAGFRGDKSTKSPLQVFPDMKHQPKYQPQRDSAFFADGRGGRAVVPGTVPQGYELPGRYYGNDGNNARHLTGPAGFSNGTDYINTGMINGNWGDGIPLQMDRAVIERGRERFTINCAICHGATASGNGIVSQYNFGGIANLQEARIRTMPDGQIFNTITHGKGMMGAYGSNVTVEDRWAIISYIRALQRSQSTKLDDVPADHRSELQ